MRGLGLDRGQIPMKKLIEVQEAFLIPNTSYAIPLTPTARKLVNEWTKLDKIMLVNMITCFSPRKKKGCWQCGKYQPSEKRRANAMATSEGRIRQRGKTKTRDSAAQADMKRVRTAREVLQMTHLLQSRDLDEE